jgi:hypothetical protein
MLKRAVFMCFGVLINCIKLQLCGAGGSRNVYVNQCVMYKGETLV